MLNGDTRNFRSWFLFYFFFYKFYQHFYNENASKVLFANIFCVCVVWLWLCVVCSVSAYYVCAYYYNRTNCKAFQIHILGIICQRSLFQLQNNWSHTAHVTARFTWFWIKVTQFGDTFPFGARFNFSCFGYKLFFCISGPPQQWVQPGSQIVSKNVS